SRYTSAFVPGAVAVGARLLRQPEDALADDVALHLVGATADAAGPLVEEHREPVAVAWRVRCRQGRAHALHGHHQVAGAGEVLRVEQLHDRHLWAGRLALAQRRLHPVAEEAGELEAGERRGQFL